MSDFVEHLGVAGEVIACEDRRLKNEKAEIIEHVLWFSDYAAAERWEKKYSGTRFLRQRRQGGFEVRLLDRRDMSYKWRKSCDEERTKIEGEPTALYPVALEGRMVSYGSTSMRLATRSSGSLTHFIDYIRHHLPRARVPLIPFYYPAKEIEGLFLEDFLGLGVETNRSKGICAIHSHEGRLLAGRIEGNDLALWPWEFEWKGEQDGYFDLISPDAVACVVKWIDLLPTVDAK